MKFYALRYTYNTPLSKRKHQPVDRRFETWIDAETAREGTPNPELLEVVVREVPSIPVLQQ